MTQKRRINTKADRVNERLQQQAAARKADKADRKYEVLAKAIKNKGIGK
jgi:hypothetical protein